MGREEGGGFGMGNIKGNPCTLLVGMKIGAATVENSMEILQKIKSRTTI